MQIEVGKFYKNEMGEKVGPMKPYVKVLNQREKWSDTKWTYHDDGFWPGTSGEKRSLISEWTETPKFIVGKAYKLRDGSRAVVETIADDALYLRRDEEETICLWASSGTTWKAHMKREDKCDIISEWHESPIQEVTIKTIVPGVYGCVSVIGSTTGEMRYHIEPYMTAEQLRDAAKVFTDIAVWLEEQK